MSMWQAEMAYKYVEALRSAIVEKWKLVWLCSTQLRRLVGLGRCSRCLPGSRILFGTKTQIWLYLSDVPGTDECE